MLVLVPLLLATASLAAQQQAPTDAETRLRWHRQHLEMAKTPAHAERDWQHIGPFQMSGRVTDLAVVPGQPWTIYAATGSGGLWKTDNEGVSWQPLFEDAPSASCGAVAVAPSRPEVVYLGLGEANVFRSSMSGTGIYRSDDGGATWRHLGLAETHHIGRIVVDPRSPEIVWVAASGREWTDDPERGVYKTTDGGRSWHHVLRIDDRVGAIDLVMDPEDPELVFASMWNRIRLKWSDPKPGPRDGIFRTRDGGASWEHLTTGLPQVPRTGRIGLALARSRPGTIYALLDNHEISRRAKKGERDSYGRPRADVIKGAEVYRSDDHGDTWRKVSKSTPLMERLFSTYGWVFGQIRVDPTDADTVFIMGVPLLKSTDGGVTFERLRYRGLHGDHHAMWIDPERPERIVNGNDGGVNISYDGGRTWRDFPNLPVVQFYNVAVDNAEPFNVFGSIQDNGSWTGPSNFRPGRDPDHLWKYCPGGEASYHAVDPTDQNVLYSESFYGRIQRSTLSPRKTVSITPKPDDGEPPLRGQWLAPFQLSTHNPFVVYHGMNCVFRSVNRGDTWEQISPDLTTDDPSRRGDISFQTISSLSESPVTFGVLYAGTDDGRLWGTRDGGGEWVELVKGLPKGKWVSRVEASRFAEGRVYLTLNGKRDNEHQAWVYVSEDFGMTWRDIAKGIPGGPVNVIREDPANEEVLFVGTDLGVYVTENRGGTWSVLGKGLPITFVHDLVIHERDRVCVVATHGRGVWTLALK